MKKIQIIFFATLLISSIVFGDGFLKVSGKKIIDEQGNEIILKGMGLGGWLLPEGYMLHTSGFADAFWQMKTKVIDVVGEQKADSFWNAYRKNFVTRKDIERLAKMGFNSVRLAMHYEFFIYYSPTGYVWVDQGFTIVDSLLRQCADNKIYLILDLHAAPGGQSANNISDYNPTYLSLWESDNNKTMTIDLWKKLAERYKNETWIGGYDILNEPAWNLGTNNIPLKNLYVAITNAIRSVDSTHIIFIEGNWYASDFSGLTPPWDKNMVYSFHKYWNENNIGAINSYLSLRNNFNIPIWLGESGENSNVWFTDCISLMEENKIGWAWWTLKKFKTIAGPFSVPLNSEYEYLLRYWKGEVAKPSIDFAMKGLIGMANGLKLENCIFLPDVVDALMRQPSDASTKPFAENIIPGKIFATNYDLGRHLSAYKDNNFQNTGSGNWNNGWAYRNDGVDIENCTDSVTNGFNVGWIETGENLHFTTNVLQNGKYNIDLRVAANDNGGFVGLSIDGKDQIIKPITKTGGWQTWSTQNFSQVDLSAGLHTLKLFFYFGGFNLNFLDVKYIGAMNAQDEKLLPTKFLLEQNYPNPFNSSTIISYQLPIKSNVTLKIFNLLGKEIKTLVNEEKNIGSHFIEFDAKQIASGLYYYRLTADGKNITKKMLLIK